MPPVENRTYHFHGIRLSTCGSSPCSHEAFLPISPAPQCIPRGQLARSLGTFGPVFPQARGLRHQSSSCCTWLSHAPTTMPHPTLWRALAFRWGLPCLLPTRLHIPQAVSRVHHVGLNQDGLGGTCAAWPRPLFVAPQDRHRVNRLSMPPSAEPLLDAASASSTARGGVELDWLTQQVRCVRGSVSRRARRASGDSPSHLSAKHHLLAPSLRLMVSFRGMLLTLQSGLERLTPQAHRVPVYPTVFPHSDMSLHGARSGRYSQSAPGHCSAPYWYSGA